MAQRKIDRFAQMSKQEELIAKKRREILEKQRTAELAKKVAAAMKGSKTAEDDNEINKKEEATQKPEKAGDEQPVVGKNDTQQPSTQVRTVGLTGRTGKLSLGLKRNQQIPISEQLPAKAQNSFCNDGSFLDHFKKIIEKNEPPKIIPEVVETPPPTVEVEKPEENETAAEPTQISESSVVTDPTPTVPMAVPMPTAPQAFSYNPNFLPQGILLSAQPQAPPHAATAPEPLAPMPAAAFFGSHFANFAPPPPPPPQLPITLANLASLYMIPAPEPLQLSTIQEPKEFDLNAIPKPQLNLEAIQVPTTGAHQQLAQPPLQGTQLGGGDFHKHFPMEENHQHQQQQQSQQQQQQQQLQQQQQQQQQLQQQQQQQPEQQENNADNNDFNCIQLPTTIENLIALVALHGDEYEDKIRTQKSRLHPAMWFLYDKNCQQYQQYQERLKERLLHDAKSDSNGINENKAQEKGSSQECGEKYDPESALGGDVDSDDEYMREMHERNFENLQNRIESRPNEEHSDGSDPDQGERKKKRRSRWGEKVQGEADLLATVSPSNVLPSTATTQPATSFANQHKPMLSKITRTDPGLLQYARVNYGSVNLDEEEWKKCEDHYKVNLLYQDMMRKREEIDRLARNGKFRYEYDSDEDVEGGTWEHKLRTAEMEATQAWAQALTKQSEGKHHIGDFLPPEELKKFMEQYDAKKNDRQPDLSDYKEYKLSEDNIGFQMLQKLGWKEGQGLGTDGAGITLPINKAPQREGNQGLGVSSALAPEVDDNEYDAYRKRMMLAYRFRPNPLNNPRRAYY